MRNKEAISFIQRRPFVAFDIKNADGRLYTVDHPEFIHHSRDGRILYYNTPEDDRLVVIDVQHVVSLEEANRPSAA